MVCQRHTYCPDRPHNGWRPPMCYLQDDTANYATQKAACKALRGDLVSYNTGRRHVM